MVAIGAPKHHARTALGDDVVRARDRREPRVPRCDPRRRDHDLALGCAPDHLRPQRDLACLRVLAHDDARGVRRGIYRVEIRHAFFA